MDEAPDSNLPVDGLKSMMDGSRGSTGNGLIGDLIRLNVGGIIFSTTRETLVKYEPESMLSKMFNSDSGFMPGARDSTGAFLIDRDPHYFRILLRYMRTGNLVLKGLYPEGLLEEAKFLGMVNCVELIEGNAVYLKFLKKNQLVAEKYAGFNFKEADCSNVDFSDRNFSSANFENCVLTNCNFSNCNLTKANFRNCNLKGANMSSCNLEKTNFSKAQLCNANFKNSVLFFTCLEDTNLQGSILLVESAKYSKFKDALIDETTLLNETIKRAMRADKNRRKKRGSRGENSGPDYDICGFDDEETETRDWFGWCDGMLICYGVLLILALIILAVACAGSFSFYKLIEKGGEQWKECFTIQKL